MSLFSSALQKIVNARGWNQTQASTEFALSQGAISNYFKGRRPAAGALISICAPLDDDERAELLTAHLRDELPGECRDLVLLTPATTRRLREEAIDTWKSAPLPPDVRKALELIVDEAIHDRVVQEWICASAAMMTPTRAPSMERARMDEKEEIIHRPESGRQAARGGETRARLAGDEIARQAADDPKFLRFVEDHLKLRRGEIPQPKND